MSNGGAARGRGWEGVERVSGEAEGPAKGRFCATCRGSLTDRELRLLYIDYRHYALSITTTESQYVFEFIPRDEGRGFKGGGARYKVDRASGKIDEEMFMK
jgi:hypothetical protein